MERKVTFKVINFGIYRKLRICVSDQWQHVLSCTVSEIWQLNPLTAVRPCGYSQRPVPHPMQYLLVRKYACKYVCIIIS